jgi:hypothetical protein
MNKIFLSILTINTIAYAEMSALEAMDLELRAEKIRKELNIHTLTEEERKIQRIRNELHLDFDTSSKATLLGNQQITSVQPLTGVKKDEAMIDSFSSALSSIKKTLLLEEDNNEYSFSSTLNSFYDTVGLDSTESWSMSSLFGTNKKEETSFISSVGIIGDTGTTIYNGMKYSGQSAELASGMVYRSSQMYNTMFGIFDASPLNIFEEKKKSNSIFDIFE